MVLPEHCILSGAESPTSIRDVIGDGDGMTTLDGAWTDETYTCWVCAWGNLGADNSFPVF